ncbi:MAG: DUF58 domain-containing protein [Proteobacteria bacterium]|nr:DUF58 domain-containing protein [Pseudomonadota bacterium]
MPTKDILKKVRKVEITTRRAVNDLVGGEYHSVFKGRGMEFDEVRHYTAGDPVNSIDWKVTARTGTPFVKRFVEERELTVILAVDVSASHGFGSSLRSKKDIIVELGALLAFSAIRNNDRVGLLTFSDKVEKYIPPKKGRSHGMRVLSELVMMERSSSGTSISDALDYLGRVEKSRGIIFLISDFIDEGYEKQVNILSKKHDLLLMRVRDKMETQLPAHGLIDLQDAETGEIYTVDPADRRWHETFSEIIRLKEAAWSDFIKKHRLDSIDIDTETSYLVPLRNFFRQRSKRY